MLKTVGVASAWKARACGRKEKEEEEEDEERGGGKGGDAGEE